MKVVVGLGNPGRRYAKTRHNIGFRVLATLAGRYAAAKSKLRFEAEVAEIVVAEEKTLLAAPQTYMNLSGRSVRKVVDFYQLALADLLVVCDDMNLKTGRLRLRRSGSSGGQKGLKNIIEQLGTEEFPRLRIGIGMPREPRSDKPAFFRPNEDGGSIDHVLSKFRADEVETIERAVERAADGVELWIREGVAAAMNSVNAPDSND